jgi:quercetin dioxygenase-like cupin family protein
MIVDGEERAVAQGDFVWVHSNAMHQLRPASATAPLRCLAFTVRPGD